MCWASGLVQLDQRWQRRIRRKDDNNECPFLNVLLNCFQEKNVSSNGTYTHEVVDIQVHIDNDPAPDAALCRLRIANKVVDE